MERFVFWGSLVIMLLFCLASGFFGAWVIAKVIVWMGLL